MKPLRPELALYEIEPVLAPEDFAVDDVARRAENAGLDGTLGVGFIPLLHGLRMRIFEPVRRQLALAQQGG